MLHIGSLDVKAVVEKVDCSMADHLDVAAFRAMLFGAALKLRAAQETLSVLDAATGDGDHGAAISKVADAIDSACAAHQSDDLPTLLNALGWAVMGTDSGSTGPLFGSFFLGMGEAVTQADLSPSDLVKALDAGVSKVRGVTKAEPGDKTLMDALVPAVEAIRAATSAGKSGASALHAGTDAAVRGAESTARMQARFGRAKHLGERSIGHADPGATSMSLLFAGLAEGLSDA